MRNAAMPELPEIETFKRNLQSGFPALPGLVVEAGEVLWPRTLAIPDINLFQSWLPGQIVTLVSRRGKFLVVHLTRHRLLFHLGMSGDLRLEALDAPGSKHDRLRVRFTNGLRLVFEDPRKFGRVWLVEDEQQVVGSLGLEPLDEAFTVDELCRKLRSAGRQLKPLLMDQGFLAGMGNIYTDEALHLAKLHPLRIANSLTQDEAARLWHAIRSVLSEGIRRNGASIDWVYRGGEFQNYFRVYHRTGQPCPECGTSIVRMVVGQRGTHICPKCQLF